MKRFYSILLIILFGFTIITPVVFFHFGGGEVDKNENRTLADYPQFTGGASKWLSGRMETEINDWINDHIGMRRTYRKMYSIAMNKINLTTSNEVVIGQDGWTYFTGNDNLEIAKGNYTFNEKDKNDILQRQISINRNYYEKGIDYMLMLTSSKVSIYPEYLPFKIVNHKAPNVIVKKTLQGSNVECIDVTDALNEKKNELLFFKTDSHWNQKGSYYAYKSVIKHLNGLEPIDVTFGEFSRTGDLNQMRGLIYDEYKETVPSAEYNWNSHKLTTGEIDSKLIAATKTAFEAENSAYIEPVVYVNDNVKEGTLLIYGDSMSGEHLNLPRYLAEHFHKVIGLRIMPSNKKIEELIDPNIVIIQVTERLTKFKLKEMTVH